MMPPHNRVTQSTPLLQHHTSLSLSRFPFCSSATNVKNWWPPALEDVMTSPPKQHRMVRPEPCDGLPVCFQRSGIGKKEVGRSRSRMAGSLVHAIPIVVLLCLLMLWWFCSPVTLEMKQGRVVATYRTDNLPFNGGTLEVVVLTEAAISPVAADAPQNRIGQNVTHQEKPRVEATKNHHDSSVEPAP